jgi:hypothetical protein
MRNSSVSNTKLLTRFKLNLEICFRVAGIWFLVVELVLVFIWCRGPIYVKDLFAYSILYFIDIDAITIRRRFS